MFLGIVISDSDLSSEPLYCLFSFSGIFLVDLTMLSGFECDIPSGSLVCIVLNSSVKFPFSQEKEEALEKVLSLFCKISRRTGNPARLALT